MSLEAWLIFAAFWVVFVTTPGPNAVNCISNGMTLGFGRAWIGVAAILTQATLFMTLSAFGITALITASPLAFEALRLIGAAFLVYVGIRGWLMAGRSIETPDRPARSVYWHAFWVATINPKSVAGYIAAFSQFVQPGVPIWGQMTVIVPTALTITALSYTGYTALGAGLGRAAMGAIVNLWVRRVLSGCLVIYGLLLGSMSPTTRAS